MNNVDFAYIISLNLQVTFGLGGSQMGGSLAWVVGRVVSLIVQGLNWNLTDRDSPRWTSFFDICPSADGGRTFNLFIRLIISLSLKINFVMVFMNSPDILLWFPQFVSLIISDMSSFLRGLPLYPVGGTTRWHSLNQVTSQTLKETSLRVWDPILALMALQN